MTDRFLDKIYDDGAPRDVAALYDAWAASYEAEISENGYVTPDRCAKALASCVPDLSAAVLDVGCGTGLSGLALRLAGFRSIDGVDLSKEMLDLARVKKIYRSLHHVEADASLADLGTYSTIAAIGVIGPGAGPATLLDTLVTALPDGGMLVFSLNDHALADPAYEQRLNDYLDDGSLRLLKRDYGPHLPKIDLNSYVYVVEKA